MEEARTGGTERPARRSDERVDRGERAVALLGEGPVEPGRGGISAGPADAILVDVGEIALRGIGCSAESLADKLALADGVAHREILARANVRADVDKYVFRTSS